MAGNIKGITIEIDGDTSGLNQALKGVNASIRSTQSELRAVEKALKLDPKNTEMLAQKQELLTKAIGETKDKLETLKEAQRQADEAMARGEKVNEEGYRALQREIAFTEASLNKLESQTEDFGDSATESTDKAKNGFEKLKTVVGDVGKVVAKVGKVIVTAIGAASAAVSAIVKESVEAYAEYEQLAGGVKKLFGDAYESVMADARRAWSESGISANRYMETVTTFSASLIKSLGDDTTKAAELSNMAINDMADNTNTFGTSMDALMTAYKGFSREQFQLLDNLNLGYAGTKQGMQELLADAEEIAGKHYDIASFSDIIEAIHVIQENLKITGTTANEAAGTISGSFNAMKAAWSNLLVDLNNGGDDLNDSIDNLIESVSNFGSNVGPAVERALSGIGATIERLAPAISDSLPSVLSDMLPKLLSAASSLVSGLAAALPSVLSALNQSIPTVISAITSIFSDASLMNDIISGAMQIITTLASGIIRALPALIPAAVNIVTALLTGLGQALPQIVIAVVQAIPDIVQALIDNIPLLVVGALQFFMAIVQAIPQISIEVFKAMPQILVAVISGLGKLPGMLKGLFSDAWNKAKEAFENPGEFFEKLVSKIEAAFAGIAAWFGNTFGEVWGAVKGAFAEWASFYGDLIRAVKSIFAGIATWFGSKFQEAWGKIKSAFAYVGSFFAEIWATIKNAFKISEMAQIGRDLIQGFWNGVKEKADEFLGYVSGFVAKVKNAFTSVKGFWIGSPSKWAKQVMEWVVEGLVIGAQNGEGEVYDTVDQIVSEIKKRVEGVTNYFGSRSKKSSLLYELWGLTFGREADEVTKANRKLESLNDQLYDQGKIVELLDGQLDEVISQYGGESDASRELENQLLRERIAYEKLAESIREVTEARDEAVKKRAEGDAPKEAYRDGEWVDRLTQGLNIAKGLASIGYSEEEQRAYAYAYAGAGGGAFQFNRNSATPSGGGNTVYEINQTITTPTASPGVIRQAVVNGIKECDIVYLT